MKFLSLLLACLVAVDSAAAQGPPKPPLTASALQSDIIGSKLHTHAQRLQHISLLSSGKRSHGTLAYNASVVYVKALLDLTGFYDTQLQPVVSKDISFTGLALSDSSPTTYTDIAPIFSSPAGLVTATLLVADNAGCASVSAQASSIALGSTESDIYLQADFPGSSTGKLLVVRRGSCTFSQKVSLAAAAGAVGVVIANNDPDPSHFFAGIVDPTLSLVPTVFVHKTGGDALITKIGITPGLTGTINVQFTGTDKVGYNLIATTRTGNRDHIVQLGAHLDSTTAGPVSLTLSLSL